MAARLTLAYGKKHRESMFWNLEQALEPGPQALKYWKPWTATKSEPRDCGQGSPSAAGGGLGGQGLGGARIHLPTE